MWVESVEFMLVPWVNINNHNYNWGGNTLQEFPQSPKNQKGIGKKMQRFWKSRKSGLKPIHDYFSLAEIIVHWPLYLSATHLVGVEKSMAAKRPSISEQFCAYLLVAMSTIVGPMMVYVRNDWCSDHQVDVWKSVYIYIYLSIYIYVYEHDQICIS